MPAGLPVRPVLQVIRRPEAAPAVTLREACEAYLAGYRGRDNSRAATLATWCELLGAATALPSLDADLIGDALETLAASPAMRFLGRDRATGAPRWKDLGLRKPSTINRYKAVLSALLTWAQRRRLLPRGYVNPARLIQSEPEHNARIRFLSEAERDRLLAVCKVSAWPRLYLLVLLALTTGARRGELLALRYRDLDLEAGTARLPTSKNKQPRVLPLVPAAGSDNQALGGALAYHYGRDGNLAALDFATAIGVLSDAGFAASAQVFDSASTSGSVRLLSAGQVGEESAASIARIAAASVGGTDGAISLEEALAESTQGSMRSPRCVQAFTEIWAADASDASRAEPDRYLTFDSWTLAVEATPAAETPAAAAASGSAERRTSIARPAPVDDAELAFAAAVEMRWWAADRAMARLGAVGSAVPGGEAVGAQPVVDDLPGLSNRLRSQAP